MLNEIGRLCVKLSGRDAGKKCVIVDIIDENYVLIDGASRRRKCNISHLEPMEKILKVSKGADHASIVSLFEKEGLNVKKETKPKKANKRPQKSHIKRDKK